jgi:aryl-alcohol dehydrogenase-like predicted oxidoreductase
VPIFGTKRQAYLKENLQALEIELTAEDLGHLDEIAPYGAAVGPRYAEGGMALVDR